MKLKIYYLLSCYVLFTVSASFLWFPFRRPARSMLPPINEKLIINKLSIKKVHESSIFSISWITQNGIKWWMRSPCIRTRIWVLIGMENLKWCALKNIVRRLILFSTKLRSALSWYLEFCFCLFDFENIFITRSPTKTTHPITFNKNKSILISTANLKKSSFICWFGGNNYEIKDEYILKAQGK